MRTSPVPRALINKNTTKERIEYDKNTSLRTSLGNRKLQIVRRKNIAACKILGMSNTQIGKIFNIGKDRVSRELKFADQEGLLDRLNAEILDELVPEAIKVYKKKMVEEADAFVAKDVLRHLDRLTARVDEKKKVEAPQYSIAAYMQAKAPTQLGEGEINISQIIRGEQARNILETSTVEPIKEDECEDILSNVVVEKK
jgi:hypothetical protein